MNTHSEKEYEIVRALRAEISRPRFGLSDADVNHEWVLQQRLRNWVAAGLRLFEEINDGSECVKVKDAATAFEAFVHDELPVKITPLGGYDFTYWDEKINECAGGLK